MCVRCASPADFFILKAFHPPEESGGSPRGRPRSLLVSLLSARLPPHIHPLRALSPSQDQPSSYKTKACRSFARTGRCPYGPRCRFMHGDVREAQDLAMLRLAAEGDGTPPFGPIDGSSPASSQQSGPSQPPVPNAWAQGLPNLGQAQSQPMPPVSLPTGAAPPVQPNGSLLPGGLTTEQLQQAANSIGRPGLTAEQLLAELLANRAAGGSTGETPPRPGQLPVQAQLGGSVSQASSQPSPHMSAAPAADPVLLQSHQQQGGGGGHFVGGLPPPQKPMPMASPPNAWGVRPPVGVLPGFPGHGANGMQQQQQQQLQQQYSNSNGSHIPSPSTSLISSTLPSTHASALSSPTYGAAQGGHTPQQLPLLPPPAMLPGGGLPPPGMGPGAQPQPLHVQLHAQPPSAAAAAPFAAFNGVGGAVGGSLGQHAGANGGVPGGGYHACCGNGGGAQINCGAPNMCGGCATDTSTSNSSGCGSRFSDVLRQGDESVEASYGQGGTTASTHFTRSSIAKQLSVLFDDGGSSRENLTLLGQVDQLPGGPSMNNMGACSHTNSEDGPSLSSGESIDSKSGEGPSITSERPALVDVGGVANLDGSLRINIDGGGDMGLLADQLAAVCCSPPRHTTGVPPWRGSSPTPGGF